MQNKENAKGRLMLFCARFVVYFILIFLAVLCLFSFYMLIINSSRGIIYASAEADFAEAAKRATETLRDTINQYRGL